jgi:cellulose synthase/poly-beta-1,6-N-acetylglucosamine synthase-like glycosyltransferase
MTILIEVPFWISLGIIVYTYLGYPALLVVLNAFRSLVDDSKDIGTVSHQVNDAMLPSITLIVAAYNEEDCIRAKVENSIGLDYPLDLVEMIVVTDGSTDGTVDIVRSFQHQNVCLLHQPQRSGKTAAINRAVEVATGDVLVFSDANTMLNTRALRAITADFRESSVGAVAGEKRVLTGTADHAVAQENLYWKYESFLKNQESQFHTVIGAAGELFAVRRNLYVPVPPNVILDDFYISLSVCRLGYTVKYARDAYGEEFASANVAEEGKRKVRIAAGGFQSLQIFSDLKNPFGNWRLALQFVSHRFFRWSVCPFLLPVVVVLNGILAVSSPSGGPYWWLFIAQGLFYMLALMGAVLSHRGIHWRLIRVPFYFAFMNWSVYLGFINFLSNKQSAVWERSVRARPGHH